MFYTIQSNHYLNIKYLSVLKNNIESEISFLHIYPKKFKKVKTNFTLIHINLYTVFVDFAKTGQIITYNFFLNNILYYDFYKNKNIKNKINLNFFLKYIISEKEFKSDSINNKDLINFCMSNKFILNKTNLFYLNYWNWKNVNFLSDILKKHLNINNFYPVIFTGNRSYSLFFKKFKYSNNLDYILFNNKLILNFLEFFFKKKVSITFTNNYFNRIDNFYLRGLINEYKNFQPVYFKNSSISDFIEVLWYSFYLKDISMLSSWITRLMESLNFKNHKKFVMFFQNFINKNSGLFIDVLKIKGFFFDIRGKVGVTGSSKKRHFFAKFGCLSKSSKNNKLDFNQNLVRSYSGVMGVTYIISY